MGGRVVSRVNEDVEVLGGRVVTRRSLHTKIDIFWLSLAVSSVVDWFVSCGSSISFGSLYSICLCDMWFESATLIFTTHLTSLCLGDVERTKQ